jgi:hypothetical protein
MGKVVGLLIYININVNVDNQYWGCGDKAPTGRWYH